jgi:hypothetical protein
MPNFTPVIKGNRPYEKAKNVANAPTSVAAWTGTKSTATQVTSSATAAQIGAALGQLIDDLRTAGVIK